MSRSETGYTRGIFLLLTATTLWGALGVVARIAFSEGTKPLEVAFRRAVIGWVFFFVHAGVRRNLRVQHQDLPLTILFALVSVSGFYGSYQFAVRFGGAARSSVLLYTAPALMAVFVLREPATLRTISGVLFSIAGVALISFAGNAVMRDPVSGTRGTIFGLISGFTYALYFILGRRLLERYRSTTLFAWILLIGAAGLLPFVSPSIPSLRGGLALLFIGFASTYLAYMAYAAGLRYLRSTQAAVIATMEPVVAAVLAYVFWGEILGPWGNIGAVLVLGSVLLQIPVRNSRAMRWSAGRTVAKNRSNETQRSSKSRYYRIGEKR